MRSLFFFSLIALLFSTACQTTERVPDSLWADASAKLTPDVVDIAVLPPVDATPPREMLIPGIQAPTPPVEKFRLAAYEQLIQRRYTPLSLDFIDMKLLGKPEPVAASYQDMRGSWGEDAVLGITINHYNASRLEARKAISIGLEAYLLSSRTGETLWQGRISRNFDFSEDDRAAQASKQDLEEKAITKIVEEIFQQIPRREFPAAR